MTGPWRSIRKSTVATATGGGALKSRSYLLAASGQSGPALEGLDQAIASYDRTLDINPQEYRCHTNRGIALLRYGWRLLNQNNPSAVLYLPEGLKAKLEAARLRPNAATLASAEKQFRDLAAALHRIRAFSEEQAQAVIQAGRSILGLRARLDPKLNDQALINQAIHFRQLGNPQLGLNIARQAMKEPRLAPAAANFLITVLIEDLNNPQVAIQFGADFLSTSSLHPAFMDEYAVLLFLCAPQVHTMEDLQRFFGIILELLDWVQPDNSNEAVFQDLCETLGAMLVRVGETLAGNSELQDQLHRLHLDALQAISLQTGKWRTAHLLQDPEDDPSEGIKDLSAAHARRILEENYERGKHIALDYIQGLVEALMQILKQTKDLPLEERLQMAYEDFRSTFAFDPNEPDDSLTERAMQTLEVLFCELLPLLLHEERIELEAEELAADLEELTRLQVNTARMFLKRCTGQGVNFGLAVLPLAIGLEEEFRSKMLGTLKQARTHGHIGPLDLTRAVCHKTEDSPGDPTCERYRNYLKDGTERFVFGDLLATWEILTGKRKKYPPLLGQITGWFKDRLTHSTLLEKPVNQAIYKLGVYRNRAAHPGKEPIDEATARRILGLCLEAVSEGHPFGLIPEMAKAGQSMRHSFYQKPL